MTKTRSGWAVVALTSLALCGVAAQGAPLDFLAANVGETPLFDASLGAMGEWNMPNAPVTNGTALAGFDFYDIAPTTLSSPPAALTWTGSPLVQDNSLAGKADGEFGAGGTLVLSGKLFLFGAEIYDGELLTASVSGFRTAEPSGAADYLDTLVSPILTPISGVLVDGTYATMPTDYVLTFTGAQAQQGGGPLVNFQDNIVSLNSFQFALNAVPEPTSVVLLAGFAGLAVLRRRSM